ncbi:DUF461 domain-containing protein [Streptomyces sp. 8K308]|uniref:DUF461 domain-containing protein n=1 Tax=Streptomyces sp. 8K308 TaxID=2530388 RepID=UPI001A9E4F16|nr:DUF461 domain-containing protein [Streptomyces sp. 8K308]
MSSSLRRGVTAAVFTFSIAALTAACGAGQHAGTSQIKPDNAYAQVDDIKVQNVNVVMTDDGSGPAGVTARLFNTGSEDQTLESINLPGSDVRAELVPADGESSVVVPRHGSVVLGGEGNAEAIIADPEAAQVALGNAQHLVFVLSDTGDIELFARVVSPETAGFEYYSDWAPTPTAPAAPEATGGAAGTGDDAAGDGTGEGGETAGAGETGETGGTGETVEGATGEDPAAGTAEGTTDGTAEGAGEAGETAEGATEGTVEGAGGEVVEDDELDDDASTDL